MYLHCTCTYTCACYDVPDHRLLYVKKKKHDWHTLKLLNSNQKHKWRVKPYCTVKESRLYDFHFEEPFAFSMSVYMAWCMLSPYAVGRGIYRIVRTPYIFTCRLTASVHVIRTAVAVCGAHAIAPAPATAARLSRAAVKRTSCEPVGWYGIRRKTCKPFPFLRLYYNLLQTGLKSGQQSAKQPHTVSQ